jgi:hypothetical protein
VLQPPLLQYYYTVTTTDAAGKVPPDAAVADVAIKYYHMHFHCCYQVLPPIMPLLRSRTTTAIDAKKFAMLPI